jgi:hypothetical protein
LSQLSVQVKLIPTAEANGAWGTMLSIHVLDTWPLEPRQETPGYAGKPGNLTGYGLIREKL